VVIHLCMVGFQLFSRSINSWLAFSFVAAQVLLFMNSTKKIQPKHDLNQYSSCTKHVSKKLINYSHQVCYTRKHTYTYTAKKIDKIQIETNLNVGIHQLELKSKQPESKAYGARDTDRELNSVAQSAQWRFGGGCRCCLLFFRSTGTPRACSTAMKNTHYCSLFLIAPFFMILITFKPVNLIIYNMYYVIIHIVYTF
jgi:hypothetical protein